MTIKEQISEYIKQLDKLEKYYFKKLRDQRNQMYNGYHRTIYTKDDLIEFENCCMKEELENRVKKIINIRKFLYALKNYEMPLYTKILINTLSILAISIDWLLAFGLLAAVFFSSFIIILSPILLVASFNLFCSIVMTTSTLGSIIAIYLGQSFNKATEKPTEEDFNLKVIIPIWNDNQFKQQGKEIESIDLKIDKSFNMNEELYNAINFAKDIVYNLENQKYNISNLLSKDQKELIKLPEGTVVNDDKNKFDLNTESTTIKFFKRKANNYEESENHDNTEVSRKRSRAAP